ncbi:MAG TPA: glycosyltransferase family 2 protein [Bryobacteraceae bacterium]|nr:glycosyltransferase family 2 protein [Bryobacteraceae bacterium]
MRKLVSIISAVYNEERAIPIFYDRLQRTLAPHRERFDFEIIFTNNASADATSRIVAELRAKDPSVQLITLSRNFGYQASVQSGLSYAAGDASIVIDADCEDPPEMIPEFLDQWEKGYDVVYGIRHDRPEPWVVKRSRDLFYHVLSASADMEIVLFMAEFALITAEVRRAILVNETSFPFLRAEIGYAGFHRLGISYKREKRVAGKTHYNFTGMAIFATAGILTASTFLLRAAAYAFPVFLLSNAAAWLWDWLHTGGRGFRFAVTVDLLYVMGMLAILGLYIARIYKNGMRRPNFIVNRKESLLNRPFPQAKTSSAQSADA